MHGQGGMTVLPCVALSGFGQLLHWNGSLKAGICVDVLMLGMFVIVVPCRILIWTQKKDARVINFFTF